MDALEQEAEAQEYALLEQQIRSEVGSLAWDIQPVLNLSQELDDSKQQTPWNRPSSRISGQDTASPFDNLSELPSPQATSVARPFSPSSPPSPTPPLSQGTACPSTANDRAEPAATPNLRTRGADSSPGTLEATLMHLPKDRMSPSAHGEAHQDSCFEFRVASSCQNASCSPTPCLPDASPRSISEPHPSPVFASRPLSAFPAEPRLELAHDPGKSHGASVSPQQLQLEEQVRKVQYQSQQQEHQQQQIAAAFAELHRAQHALHQERLAFEAHKESVHAQMRATHSRQQESLQKQRAQLDEQRGALAQLPTRKERAEVEAAAALVEQLRKDSKAKDSRHKLSMERMRRQILVLQDANVELKNENQATKKELEKLRADTSKKSKKRAKNMRSISCQTSSDADFQQAPSDHGTSVCAQGARPGSGAGHLDAACSKSSVLEPDTAPHTATSAGYHSENQTQRADSASMHRANSPQVCNHHQQAAPKKQSPPGYMPQTQPSQTQSQTNPNRSSLSMSISDLRIEEAPATCSRDTAAHAMVAHEVLSQSSGHPSAHLGEFSRPRSAQEHHSAQSQVPQVHKGSTPQPQSIDQSSPDFDIRFHEPDCEPSHIESSTTACSLDRSTHLQDMHGPALHSAQANFARSESLERLQAVADCQERIRMNSKPHTSRGPSLESMWSLPADHQGHDRHLPAHVKAAPYTSEPPGISVRASQQGHKSPTLGSLLTSEHIAARSSHTTPPWAPSWRTSTPTSHSSQNIALLSQRANSKPPTPECSGSHNTHSGPGTGAARPDSGSPASLKEGPRSAVKMVDDTQVVTMGDGTVSVLFRNGDIKQTKRCGTVEYFYKEMSTWHTTLQSGVEVFYFPNGQTEAHHADGSKEMLFSDGSIRMILPDGSEVPHHAAALSEAVLAPKPVKPTAFLSATNSPAHR